MADKRSSSSLLLKIGVVLVLMAGAYVGASYALRSVVTVAPVKIGVAADAVSGTVVVHADGDLKELKSEVPGRVVESGKVDPDGRFNTGEILVQLDTTDIDLQIEEARRGRRNEVERQRVQFAGVKGWQEARTELDAAERALAERKSAEQAVAETRSALELFTEKAGPAWTEAKARFDAAEQALAGKTGSEAEVARLQEKLDGIVEENSELRKNAQRAIDLGKTRLQREEITQYDLDQLERALQTVLTGLRQAALSQREAKESYEVGLRRLERTKERMSIRAPDTGQISEGGVFKGKLINAGETLAKWFSDDRVVVAKIGEEKISRVKVGQGANVTLLKYPGKPFAAHVTKILTSADPDTQLYTVHLKIDQATPQELSPFATGEVTILIDEQPNRLLIPSKALFQDNWVAVVRDGVVRRKQIEVGYRSVNQAEVKSGLAEGDLVIVAPPPELHAEGQRVRTEPSKKP